MNKSAIIKEIELTKESIKETTSQETENTKNVVQLPQTAATTKSRIKTKKLNLVLYLIILLIIALAIVNEVILSIIVLYHPTLKNCILFTIIAAEVLCFYGIVYLIYCFMQLLDSQN